MTGFSFTMTNGSMFHWDAPDPEHMVMGMIDPEDFYCDQDDNMLEAIDKQLNLDVDFRK